MKSDQSLIRCDHSVNTDGKTFFAIAIKKVTRKEDEDQEHWNFCQRNVSLVPLLSSVKKTDAKEAKVILL